MERIFASRPSTPVLAEAARQFAAMDSGQAVSARGGDFSAMMREVDFLLEKRFPLGLALVLGDIDAAVCRQIKRAAVRQADYVNWIAMGPVLLAVFRRGLFDELSRAWRTATLDDADITAGVAFSDSLRNHEDLLAAARIALTRAICRHADMLVLDSDEARQAIDDHRMAIAMKKQLANGGGDFEAHFQPQIEIGSGRPAGVEALARWHPNGEFIQPSRFIPIAEENGLIGEIDEMMLALAARALKKLRADGLAIPRIAVNVSPLQGSQDDFLRAASRVLAGEGLRAADIELEITESLVGNGSGDFLNWLADLSSAGFRIAIDDFGTGSSTLAHICNIPAHKIKLDRKVVTSLPDNQTACTTCRSALDLVRASGKTSLAEGVERRAQAAYLGSLGCIMGQGHLWAKPMPENNLLAWWSTHTAH